MKNTLYICRGYPGQGKTTFANKFFPNSIKLENDQFFYHSGNYEYDKNEIGKAINWCMDMTKLALSNGCDCVVSNTFTKKLFVNSYKHLAESFGCDFKVYRLMGNFKNIHNLPPNILENMKNNFEDYEGEIFVYPKEDGSYDFQKNKVEY